jgi:hypothetical protein
MGRTAMGRTAMGRTAMGRIAPTLSVMTSSKKRAPQVEEVEDAKDMNQAKGYGSWP